MDPFNTLFSNEDISKITNYLEPYRDKLPLIYKWRGLTDKAMQKLKLVGITDWQISSLSKLNSFSQVVEIKELVGKRAKVLYDRNDEKFNAIAHWIIYDWGGIRIAEDSKIFEGSLKDYLENKEFKFDGISSCSKVLSFLNPDLDVIYDSRVAHTLNWIILSSGLKSKFFCVPSGVGKSTTFFDIETLIRLLNRTKYFSNGMPVSGDNKIFIEKNDTYYYYRILIKKIHDKLWGHDEEKRQKLFYTEMILFALAETIVLAEIPQNVSVSIQNGNVKNL